MMGVIRWNLGDELSENKELLDLRKQKSRKSIALFILFNIKICITVLNTTMGRECVQDRGTWGIRDYPMRANKKKSYFFIIA